MLIAGIYSSPGLAVQSPGPDDEFVVLVHGGSEPADIAGWSLTNRKRDQVDHYRYLFPRFLSNGDPWICEPGGLVVVHTGRGRNSGTASRGESRQFHLFQHRTTRVWADPGDVACLYDRSGRLIAFWELPVVPYHN